MKVGDLVRAKTTIYANGDYHSGGFGVVLEVDVKPWTALFTAQTRILWNDGTILMADKNYMEVMNEKG